jgi:phosphate starvation-inducible protein PhoH
LNQNDVIRHPLVKKIIDAFAIKEEQEKNLEDRQKTIDKRQ